MVGQAAGRLEQGHDAVAAAAWARGVAVASRDGLCQGLHDRNRQRRVRAEPRGESARIELEWIREYFRTSGAADGADDAVLDSAAVSEWLRDAVSRRAESVRPDSPEEIRARLSRG